MCVALCWFVLPASVRAQTPQANPARPTVTNPATLPPVGYLQFEQGYLGSLDSPATASQYGFNFVAKIAVDQRLMLEVQTQPFAQSRETGDVGSSGGSGDVLLGAQAVLSLPAAPSAESAKTPQTSKKAIARPTVSVAYLGRVHAGTTPDIDQGGYANSVLLLVSGDVGKFHYDSNYVVNEQTDTESSPMTGAGAVLRRAQFAQTLSVNHPVGSDKLQLSVELYHFTQPLVHATAAGRYVARANLVDGLLALSYALRPNLVLDGGLSHGFTSTSTRWQSFAGFTYLLPHRLWPGRS
ncbi:MAG TPA: transporter [Acidobacteriaceae bacterium]|nr:transporter [Acidobacteriaceae bacterium]